MVKRTRRTQKPVITKILEYLTRRYYPHLLPLTDVTRIAQHFEAQAKLAALKPEFAGFDISLRAKTVTRILEGEDQHTHETTRVALAVIFKEINSDIDPAWFQLGSLEAFIERDQAIG